MISTNLIKLYDKNFSYDFSKETAMKIMLFLYENGSRYWSISDVKKHIGRQYPHVHKTIITLADGGLIRLAKPAKTYEVDLTEKGKSVAKVLSDMLNELENIRRTR